MSQHKKQKIRQKIEKVLDAHFMPVKELAGLYGLLIWVYKAVGPVIRLLTRFGFQCINDCQSWNQYVKISAKCKEELLFIAQYLDEMEGFKYKSCSVRSSIQGQWRRPPQHMVWG